ncbi:MAG: gamma-glutamylputrescine oxidase [Paraburkholderia sp.]|nr:gamma-glutamylputrescine oxidase [Paraburkholderia sp.]
MYNWSDYIAKDTIPNFEKQDGIHVKYDNYDSPNYFYVQGFSGHDVALTGIAGRVIAKAMAGETAAFDLFAQLRHARFPAARRCVGRRSNSG